MEALLAIFFDARAALVGLSARAYDRIPKVARTIADLDGRTGVSIDDISEAFGYRGARSTAGLRPTRGRME